VSSDGPFIRRTVPISPEQLEAMTVRAPRKVTKTLEPVGEAVVFRPVEADRTEAGLYVPQKGRAAETMQKAIIAAVGPDVKRFAPGDWIVLWPDAPTPGEVSFTGERLFLCRERDIACKVVPLPAEDAS
jgi:co-chaperonin GroES (HSP10)